jgi:hypothetical protein
MFNNQVKIGNDATIYFYIDEKDRLQGCLNHYKISQLLLRDIGAAEQSIQECRYGVFKQFKNVLHNEEWLG